MDLSNIKTNQDHGAVAAYDHKHAGEIAVQGDPYDFMRRGFFRNDIHDFYLLGKTSALTHVISSSLKRFRAANQPITQVYIELSFYTDLQGEHENGSACVTIDLLKKQLKVISARDVDNNQVPTCIEDVSGNDFALSSLQRKDKFDAYIGYMLSKEPRIDQYCIAVDCEKVAAGGIYTYQLYSQAYTDVAKLRKRS